MDTAWSRLLGNTVRESSASGLRELFQDTECLEKRNFSVVHKTVLGMVGLGLEDQLKASTSTINCVDNNGRTAISWAAARGDVAAIKVLLRYGADANMYSLSRMVPLHFAARARTCDPIRALLRGGAEVDFRSDCFQTALHHAAAYQDDESYIECLVEAGADINARDADGYSPLIWTALSGHPRAAASLLQGGAHMELPDENGLTALLHSVECNSHEVLQVLLAGGAKSSARSTLDMTVFHVAAEKGDVQTLDILEGTDLQGASLDSRDSEGLTAMDRIYRRSDAPPELVARFKMLLENLRSLQAGDAIDQPLSVDTEDECAVDIFEDALEHVP